MKVELNVPVYLNTNNERVIRIRQSLIDGPITVRVLGAPRDVFGSRPLETMYEISPDDMVTMLNWYRYQKEGVLQSMSIVQFC